MRDHSSLELALIAESMSQPPDQRTAWILKRKAEIAAGGTEPKPLAKAVITAEEFTKGYAMRSGVPVQWLKDQGMVAEPCDCGDDECPGWQMSRRKADVPADWSER